MIPGCNEVVSVSAPKETSKLFSFYPNPVQDLLYVVYHGDILLNNPTNVSLQTLNGAVVKNTNITFEGNAHYILSTSDLPAGSYVLRFLKAEYGYQQVEVIIRQ